MNACKPLPMIKDIGLYKEPIMENMIFLGTQEYKHESQSSHNIKRQSNDRFWDLFLAKKLSKGDSWDLGESGANQKKFNINEKQRSIIQIIASMSKDNKEIHHKHMGTMPSW